MIPLATTDKPEREAGPTFSDRPLIGITGSRTPAAEVAGTPYVLFQGWYDTYLHHYPSVVAQAGGLPVEIPREADPRGIVERLDGMIIAGGQDVDPRRYGGFPTAASTRLDPARDGFEISLIEAAVERDIPLIGVCRGAQLMTVARGGSLIPDLVGMQQDEHTLVLYPPEQRTQAVRFTSGSRLEAIYGEDALVNSFHHQGIHEPGRGVAVTGVAPDGVIEAIELEDARAIGVQWHPELLADLDPLFPWLVEEALRTSRLRQQPPGWSARTIKQRS